MISLAEEPDLNEAGDKLYNVNNEELLFEIIDHWNEGELDLGEVKVTREYIHTEHGALTRICHTEVFHKENKPKATIAILHGFGQNSDLFMDLAIQYAMNGYKVELIDFRGYGWSGGNRGHFTLIEMQNDIVALLKEVDPELPLILYAHSMGCMITLSFLMNNPDLNISGLVLQAPLIANPPYVKIDSARLMLADSLAKNLPEMIIGPGVNPSSVTKKALILKWFLTNRKCVPIIGARQAAVIGQYMCHMKYNAKQFSYPLLVHLGAEDTIVNNEATKKFYEQVSSEEKQMFEYEDCFHELQHEACKREMIKNTLDWINFRTKEGNVTKLGAIDFEKIKVGFLKKKAPFKHWKALITTIVIIYYLIGYIGMVTKFINKDRHEMLALWPCSLWRKLRGYK